MGEIGAGQVGLEKRTVLEIGIPEIAAGQVGLDKIGVFHFALPENGFRYFQESEIRVIDQAVVKPQSFYLCGPCPVDTDCLAVRKLDLPEFTVHRDNVAQVASGEFTVQEPAFLKPGTGEGAGSEDAFIEHEVARHVAGEYHSGQFFPEIRILLKGHDSIIPVIVPFVLISFLP